ncbi:NAD-dependent deacetylase [Cutibacterium acnes]|nr:NAD-dependent deacetylase [Cutibacterium acnes]
MPGSFQGSQGTVTSIGPGLRMDEVGAVEVEELRGMLN